MTRASHFNELDPTPNAAVLAEMEMQPEHYQVISLGAGFPRPTSDDTAHARAHVVIGIGKDVSRDEVSALVLDAIAALSAYLESPRALRLDYRPGPGDGATPPDAAIPTGAWLCAHCKGINDTDTEHCTHCGRWHNHEGKALTPC